MIAVSDTSPINYLVLIELQELLPKLLDHVPIPEAVHRELQAITTFRTRACRTSNASRATRRTPAPAYDHDSHCECQDARAFRKVSRRATPRNLPAIVRSSAR
jgi:hypothetical protein